VASGTYLAQTAIFMRAGLYRGGPC
jgi:hypothetical protein